MNYIENYVQIRIPVGSSNVSFVRVDGCRRCGNLVYDRLVHEDFHARLLADPNGLGA